jgi:hypothetical protein
MDEQRQNRLVLGMMSEDEATASSSAEELVDMLWADSEDSEARQEEICAAEGLRAGLVNMLCTGLEDAQYWACLALSHVAHRHPLNIARIGRQPRIFDGLNRCLGFLETKGVACGVLSQLAFCNTYNSNAIAETEGLLQRIVTVMGSPRAGDRQAATCALSNCAANSKRVARQIVSVDGMLDALKALCRYKKNYKKDYKKNLNFFIPLYNNFIPLEISFSDPKKKLNFFIPLYNIFIPCEISFSDPKKI